jgi:hypothetical protein
MPNGRHVGSPARVAYLGLASVLSSTAGAHAVAPATPIAAGCGSRENPIEVALPFELQAQLFHSLPIAGFLATPDTIAERVLLNPRLRAPTGRPLTGMGRANPISGSGVAGTHADPPD